MKQAFMFIGGIAGSLIASLFGGWSEALTTLLIVMGIDFLTGVILASIFHKSPKTETGAYDSKVGWKGLFRKGMVFCILIISHRIDLIIGDGSYVMNAVCIAFIINDCFSIIENAGLMGVPIPQFIKNTLNMLKQKNEGETDV